MKKILKNVVIVILIFTTLVLGINFYVRVSTSNQIIKVNEYKKLKDVDCIIILGAGVWKDKPSPMLEDRLLKGIDLYQDNVSSKIIMSGDHGRKEYDEVNIMKEYAIEKGIASSDIFMDHAGFSTYDSIYRAKNIFEAKKVVIVTQKYHLYRALYIANKLGLEAYGVEANPTQYAGATYRELREILARDKDFFKCIFKPKPTYLGETIPVSGNGDITNDNYTHSESINKDEITITKSNVCNDTKFKDYYKEKDRTIYFSSCVEELNIQLEDKTITLKEHLTSAFQTFDDSIKSISKKMNKTATLKDGGTTIYKNNNATMIVCNTLEGNKDIFIGDSSMNYEQDMCK